MEETAGGSQKNGRIVVETLKKGKDAAFITLGDPLIYSTFGYIMRTIQKTYPDIPIKIIRNFSKSSGKNEKKVDKRDLKCYEHNA